MLGPLDAVIAHLAFDDPSSGAQPPAGQQFGADLADRADQGRGEVERGGAPLGAHAAPGGAQRTGEGDPVGIDARVVAGGVHQGADGVMHA